MFDVDVVYISPEKKIFHQTLCVASGSTVKDVLVESSLYENYPETKHATVGIFSQQVSLDELVKHGDRIEVYRDLIVDPMEKRRRKARDK